MIDAAAPSTIGGCQWESLLSNASFASLIAAVTLAGPADGAPQPKLSHEFELVSSAPALKADGSPEVDRYDACLYGRHEPGREVLLLSTRDSTTCSVTTGRVGQTEYGGGDCTVLLGMEGCAGSHELGVKGSRGAYKLVEARPTRDEERRLFEKVISNAKAAETAKAKWSNNLEVRPYGVRDRVDAVLSWPGRDGMPPLARLEFDDPCHRGPWIAMQGGRVDTIVGPLSVKAPWAFTLDGKAYIVFEVAACLDCGGVGTEVYEVRAGTLHRVLQSFANAN